MSKNTIPARKHFMTNKQAAQMADAGYGVSGRTHKNCIEATGVARPGKTGRDKALQAR